MKCFDVNLELLDVLKKVLLLVVLIILTGWTHLLCRTQLQNMLPAFAICFLI